MENNTELPVYRRKDLLSVAKICERIPGMSGGPCSRQHVYNLIDRGELMPVFRFGRRKGLFVPKEVVLGYVSSCRFDPNA